MSAKACRKKRSKEISINNNLKQTRKMEADNKLRVFANDSGFVMVGGKLQEALWLETQFQFKEKSGTTLYYNSVTKFRKPDGAVDMLDDYGMAFDSVEEYERGIPAKTICKTLDGLKNGGDVVNDIARGVKKSCAPEYWVFDKIYHVPVKYELKYEKFTFDYSDHRFHTDEFPKDCGIYDTREEAFSYNTYRIIEKDGTEHERDGVNKLIMLDDDQRELVAQFEQLCDKMKGADLMLAADYDVLSVFNLRKVEHFVFDYNEEPNVDVGNSKDYEKADRYGTSFTVRHDIEYWDSDHHLFIKRKLTENKTK